MPVWPDSRLRVGWTQSEALDVTCIDVASETHKIEDLVQLHVRLDIASQVLRQLWQFSNNTRIVQFVLELGQYLLLASGTAEVTYEVGMARAYVLQGLLPGEMLRAGSVVWLPTSSG